MSARFGAKLLGVPVDVGATIDIAGLHINGTVKIGAFSLGGVALDNTEIALDITPLRFASTIKGGVALGVGPRTSAPVRSVRRREQHRWFDVEKPHRVIGSREAVLKRLQRQVLTDSDDKSAEAGDSGAVGRVGVVLGAGGAVGHAFHAGVLSALADETGWDPRRADVIVGTSAGSVVASMLRAGFSASDVAARALGRPLSAEGVQLVQRSGLPAPPPTAPPSQPSIAGQGAASPIRLARAFWQPWRARPGTIAAALLPEGQISNELMSEPLRRLFGSGWPSQSLWVVAVELDSGRRVVFGRTGAPDADVADAVAASCAIPAYFVPVTIDGARYVDGGVHSPSNADVLAEETLDLVIVSSPMSTSRGVVRRGIDVPMRHLTRLALAREVAALRRRGTTVVTFQPSATDQEMMAGNPLDPAKRAPVCQQVYETTTARLRRADLRRRLAALA